MSGPRTDKGFTSAYSKASLVLLPLFGIAVTATSASAQVVSTDDGTATVVDATGDQFDITGGQLSDDEANLFHSFEQFDLSAEETANFETIPNVQNVIGKVSGQSASSINGTLRVSGSDANLYLMNPAGILVGPNAQLNLSGGFTATTATGIEFENGQFDAGTADYGQLAGTPTGFRFAHEQGGAVVNAGDLNVGRGKSIGLIGGTVVNTGKLSAPEGTVTIAAVEGESLVRISQGDQLLSLEVEAMAPNEISSTVTAQSIGSMLTGSGVGNATALIAEPDGTVRLGSMAIDERGGSAIAAGNISTVGAVGGEINVLGDRVSLIEASLDASGTNGGGLVRVGGDYKGNGTVTNATHTLVDSGSVISANALETGDGGRSIIWADNTTQFYGAVEARGGALGGDGGFAEISGKTRLVAEGGVDLTAPQGSIGTVLLDPENLIITDELPIPPNDGTTSYLSSDYVEELSDGGNVELEATNDFTIQPLADGKLEFESGRSITFKANSDGTGSGAFRMSSGDTIRAEKGNVFISGMGIAVGTIDTSTNEEDEHGPESEVSGGSVELVSTLGIDTTEILTYGERAENHSGNGGSVTLEAMNGDVVIRNAVKTYSYAGDHESKTGGDITITASGGISVGTETTTESILDSSSTTTRYSSGDGGIIRLTALAKDINIAGNISSESSAGENQRFYDQSGGIVHLEAQNGSIVVGDITTSAKAGRQQREDNRRAGSGGDVFLIAGVDISAGLIDTTSETEGVRSSLGGTVKLTADGTLRTKDIVTDSVAGSASADAGTIELKARTVEVDGGLSSLSIDNGTIVRKRSNSIQLTGDTIRLGGGVDSVRGASVDITPFSPSRTINVGGDDSDPLVLSITNTDIAAIERNVGSISIIGDGTGIAQVDSSVTSASKFSRADLNIKDIEALVGSDESTIYDIARSNGGEIIGSGDASTSFSNVLSIYGGKGDDAFRVKPGVAVSNFKELNGGEGVNVLEYTGFTVGIDLSLLGLSNVKAIAPKNSETSTLMGVDLDSIWRISDANSGVVSNTSGKVEFEGFSNLVGGDRADRFVVEDAGKLTGGIEGGEGDDTLSYAEFSGPVTVDLTATQRTAVRFSEIENFVGNSQIDSLLIGSDGDDEFEITGDRTGTINNKFTFSNFATIDGAKGKNTLDLSELSTSTSSNWEINGSNRGNVGNLDFQNIGTLLGGDGDDTFAIVSGGSVSGELSGGGGDNELNYSGYGSAIEVTLENNSATGLSRFAAISSLVGSSESDFIRGTSGDDVFKITGDRAGEANGLKFLEIESIAGEQGKDTLDYSGYGDAVEINLAGMNSATGLPKFSSIENIVGSGASDKIIGTNNEDTFNIAGDGKGNINGDIEFSSVERISGGGGSNTLSYSGYSTPVEISFLDNSATGITKFSNIETIAGGGANDLVIGSAGNDQFKIEALSAGSINLAGNSSAIRFSSIERVEGDSGLDQLDYSSYGTAIDVDLESLRASGLSAFAGIESIVGSSAGSDIIRGANGDDTFQIRAAGAGSVNQRLAFSSIEQVNGSLGVDTLDYSGYGSTVDVSLGDSQATGLVKFEEVERFIGSNNKGTIEGTAGNDLFKITGDRAGMINGKYAFSNFGIIDGVGGSNIFILGTPAVGSENRWRINQANNGFLDFGAASTSPALTSSITFKNFEQIVGNEDNNFFEIAERGSVAIASGNSGFDTISYASNNSPISVDLQNSIATGITKQFSNIESFIGNNHNSELGGQSSGSRWTILGVDSGLADGISFTNFNQLVGQGGDNVFDFESGGLITGKVVGGSDGIDAQNRITSDIANANWQLGAGKNIGTFEDAEGAVLAKFSRIQNLENDTTGGVHKVIFTEPNSQITGSIDSGDSDLILLGDDINIGNNNEQGNLAGGEIAGSRTLTILSRTADVGIELGGTDSQGAALSITDGEIAAIQDSFSQVIIGDRALTNSLLFRGDVSLGSDVTLQSRGEVDTAGYRLSAEGGISVESDRITAGAIDSRESVSLTALEDIAVASVSAGGQGIDIKSELGGIVVDGAIATSGQQLGNGIRLIAQTDIAVGDVRTEGGTSSANISSALGGIAAAGITTSSDLSSETAVAGALSGGVTLKAQKNIEVEFIDATGVGDRTDESGFINIETAEDFTATGYLPGTLTSLSTAGIENGTIDILYGNENRPKEPFIVGQPSKNGTAGSIRAAVEILSGEVPSGLSQGNITIASRGFELAEPREPIAPLKIVQPLTEQASAPEIVISNGDGGSMEILSNLESAMGGNFDSYLNLSDGKPNGQALTLEGMQETLQGVEQVTGTTPALVYVYFVPDAASELSVSSEDADKKIQASAPEDQLEVMLINATGEPIRKRRWGITREQVEAVSRDLRQQITSQFTTPRQYLEPAQQLYDWIIRPIARDMKAEQVESIGFVMDTGLRTLPLAALHDGEEYLVENYSLGLLPTYSLTEFKDGTEEHVEFETARVLAMGASRFEDQPDLPAVDAEVGVVTSGDWEGDAFLNEDFVLENLQTQIKGQDYGVVHLATHASFESGDLDNSYIQLWDKKLALNDIGQLGLDESNVGLIILSACNTALGDQASEYGFAGFAVNSGSQSAMASLWPVNDEGTLGFMSQFYGELKQAPVKAEALRQAQMSLIRGDVGVEDGVVYGKGKEAIATLPSLKESGRWDFSHPFFWSAFTMIGNPW